MSDKLVQSLKTCQQEDKKSIMSDNSLQSPEISAELSEEDLEAVAGGYFFVPVYLSPQQLMIYSNNIYQLNRWNNGFALSAGRVFG